MLRLHWIDGLLLLGYFVGVIAVGLWFGRRERDTEDFVTGGRRVPWWAVLGSIIATEISAVTFLAVPGEGYGNNLNYLQFGIGSIVARFLIAGLFLGAFYRFRCQTIYEFLRHRFGGRSQTTAAIFFLCTRLLASAVRLLIATTGLAVFFGVPLGLSLTLFTATAILYTAGGGIKAVIATDVLQGLAFTAAGLAVVLFLGYHLGWSEIWEIGRSTGRLEVIRWSPSDLADRGWVAWLQDPNVLALAFLNGLVMTLAALGTDQDLSQRMLTCRSAALARRSVILSGLIGIPITVVFMLIGVGLFAYYQAFPDPTLPGLLERGEVQADKVFPHFIATALPIGLKGLLLIGILATAMSSMDSALGALSSSVVVDFYRRSAGRHRGEAHLVLVARWAVVAFGLGMAVIAYSLRSAEGFLWLGFKIGSVTYGSLLGIFLLGLLTQRRGNDRSNLWAMVSASAVTAALLYAIETQILPLAWTWLVLLGTVIAFTIGACGRTAGPRLGPDIVPQSEQSRADQRSGM